MGINHRVPLYCRESEARETESCAKKKEQEKAEPLRRRLVVRVIVSHFSYAEQRKKGIAGGIPPSVWRLGSATGRGGKLRKRDVSQETRGGETRAAWVDSRLKRSWECSLFCCRRLHPATGIILWVHSSCQACASSSIVTFYFQGKTPEDVK